MQFHPNKFLSKSYSPIIALGEGWTYFMGRLLADRRYEMNSSKAIEQHREFDNNDPLAGFSSHLNVLENFDPNRTVDEFRWIPQGLFYDLMDDRNENSPIIDGVSGFSISQIMAPLESGIKSIPAYRNRFQELNFGNQTQAITDLFGQYYY